MRKITLCVALLTGSLHGFQKDGPVPKYEHKGAEVLTDNLVVGYCKNATLMGQSIADKAVVTVTINDQGIGKVINQFKCDVEPLHKGDILLITKSYTVKHGRWLALLGTTLPHSLTRGIGSYEHESIETGRVIFGFEGTDNDALVTQYLKITDSLPDQLGNTASSVVVKEVKLGMTFGQVEEALGVPQTRVDLGEKVLYKYKDMTVEFRDGKVSDVR